MASPVFENEKRGTKQQSKRAIYGFDDWNKLNDHMTHILENFVKEVVESCVRDIATILAGDNVVQLRKLIEETVEKVKQTYLNYVQIFQHFNISASIPSTVA